MDKKKVTRRAVIGSTVGGLVAAPLVIRALRGRYKVDMPDGPVVIEPRQLVTKYGGKEITLDIPRMEIKTPEDKKKLEGILMEQLKKKPEYLEVNKMNIEKWKEEHKNSGLASIDEIEARTLKELASSNLPEKQKQALTKQAKDNFQASRAKVSAAIDGLKHPFD